MNTQNRRRRLTETSNHINRARYSSMEATAAIEAMDAVLDAGGYRMTEADNVIELCRQTIRFMEHSKITMMLSPDKKDD